MSEGFGDVSNPKGIGRRISSLTARAAWHRLSDLTQEWLLVMEDSSSLFRLRPCRKVPCGISRNRRLHGSREDLLCPQGLAPYRRQGSLTCRSQPRCQSVPIPKRRPFEVFRLNVRLVIFLLQPLWLGFPIEINQSQTVTFLSSLPYLDWSTQA